MNELLPCPFCGGEARILEQTMFDTVFFGAKCVICGAEAAAKQNKAEAIVAWNTRTHGTLTAEQVREAIYNGSSYASYDGVKYYASGINMQAIANELNSRAERTCHEFGSVRVWQSCNVWSHELSCGHEVDTLEAEPPNYCPNCGAKVQEND